MNDDIKLRAITNAGYYSDFFLNYRLTASPVLKAVFEAWKVAEKNGDVTPKTRLRALWRTFDARRPDAATTAPDDDLPVPRLTPAGVDAHHALVDATLAALGWTADGDTAVGRGDLRVLRAGSEYAVPVSFQKSLPSGPLLVAVDTLFASSPDDVAGSKDAQAGQLLEAANTRRDREGTATLYEVADLLFNCDTPPRYLLACSGASLVLLDSDTWHEGRWLGVDLDDALDRRDDSAGGELAVIAAMFGPATLDPAEGPTNLQDTLRDHASREATGVSKELRKGMRRALEALANAVVTDMRLRQRREVLGDVDLPRQLTRQCLRYLYRTIVLLYAEAKPELGILPIDHPEYHEGYGLERLRHLALVDLHSQTARQNNHIQQSLAVLFRVVNDGHQPASQGGMFEETKTLTFSALRSTLFQEQSCPLIDRAHVSDAAMQEVLRNLCFTEPKTGKPRESISYATLGVAQLGAVYEGLMSWTGFIATEDLFEIDKDGDPDTGSWVIPATQADQYPDDVFLMRTDDHGRTSPVLYKKYDFVYRLAGRDRERAAAFYTPEILTEFTVRHALAEFFASRPYCTAQELLDVTLCEPALGSGAFLNETVAQLAEHYLRLRQAELDDAIAPDSYQIHLQRAKAHFAVNCAYGVDLNPGGIELAEVSVWLNCMHSGLTTPHLDARLRNGNSLIGARRATYSADQVAAAMWSGSRPAPPQPQPLDAVPLGQAAGIHHFLVPGAGWGIASANAELRGRGGRNPFPGVATEWAKSVGAWRQATARRPSAAQVRRLEALARRVEAAWAAAALDATAYHRANKQRIDGLYGADVYKDQTSGSAAGLRFRSCDSPAGRLRTIMNAWCALWMWSPAHGTELPHLDEWIEAAELLLGQPDATETGQLLTPYEMNDGTLESVERFGKASTDEVMDRYPWLVHCSAMADEQAFFHWELEHAPIFQRGGFDLVVGNPPWTKLSRTDTDVLVDANPRAAIEGWASARVRDQQDLYQRPDVLEAFEYECGRSEGTAAFLACPAFYPLTSACLTNLYLSFIERGFWLSGNILALLHQEAFYEDAKAIGLRRAVLRRLRRHWHFVNELTLFEDVDNHTEFGVHVYGRALASPLHAYAANILTPQTVDRSLEGGGEDSSLPGKKDDDGDWDLRPHPERILRIDADALRIFTHLSEEGTPDDAPRLLRLYARTELRVLEGVLSAAAPVRITRPKFSTGLHESSDASGSAATLIRRVAKAPSLSSAVIKGPNIHVANPMYQEANEGYRHSKDNRIISASDIEGDFVPRTVLQPTPTARAAQARVDAKADWPASGSWRQVWPEHISRGWVRCFQPALIPPGTIHGHSLESMAFADISDLVRFHALCCSTIFEYLVRVVGSDHLGEEEIGCLPYPHGDDHAAWPHLLVRVLRLNCLTEEFASLWTACWDEAWRGAFAISEDARLPNDWKRLTADWDEDVPVRNDYARWRTLIEIDALATLILRADPVSVEQVGRQHLGLLTRYERRTLYDRVGDRISGEFHNRGGHQLSTDQYQEAQRWMAGETEADVSGLSPPFDSPDRWQLFRAAIQDFGRLLDQNDHP